MVILPKADLYCKFSTIPIKIPVQFFIELEDNNNKIKQNKKSTILKFNALGSTKDPGGILNSKITGGSITISEFKLYYRITVVKSA